MPAEAAPEPDPGAGLDEQAPDGGSGGSAEPDPGAGEGSGGNGSAAPAPPPRPRPDPEAVARTRAAEQARAQARLERQRARAAERAAKAAAAAEKVRVSWEHHGRPRQMVIVRERQIDVVTDGRHTRRAPRRQGPLTLGALDRYLPGPWLAVADGTAVLAATVVLTPGATLEVSGVRALKLVGGPHPADAASIYTGSGRLALRGVSVTSLDPVSQQAVAPAAAGRPFILVSSGGRLDSVDSAISDLGTLPLGASDGCPGVSFNPGSSGSLVRTELLHNSTGVLLSRSEGVHLEDVTATRSAGDGVVLRGDRATTMSGIRAVGNGGNGVVVTGENSGRPVTGVQTSGNGAFGMVVMGQTGALISGVATTGDEAGGLRINRSTDSVITDFTADDQPIGIFTHVNSTGIVLDRVHTTGGRRGVVAEKSTRRLDVVGSTFEGARVAGLSLGGQDVDLDAVHVADSRTGVRIERGASDVRVNGLVVNGGEDGVVATPGTRNVVVSDLVANHVKSDAVRTFSPDTRIVGGVITGGSTGLDIGAAAAIDGTTITGADEGIHSRSAALVRVDRVTVDAISLGVNAVDGSPLVLSDSRVHALESVRGDVGNEGVNDLSLPPLNLLGAIGVPLILLALVLEVAHAVRLRGFGGRKRTGPPSVAVSTG
jgi:hypothetical protein